MIELVLTLCLVGVANDCREERHPFDGALMQCAVFGELTAAGLLADRPKLRLAGWRCETTQRAI